jgi:hypothetical protein
MAGVYPTLWALSLLLARPRPAARTSQTTTKSDQLLRASDREARLDPETLHHAMILKQSKLSGLVALHTIKLVPTNGISSLLSLCYPSPRLWPSH